MSEEEPQFVQDIEKSQGITVSPVESPTSTFGFYQWYGDKADCVHDDKNCSNDGQLWSTEDSTLMCTKHFFNLEASECEFAEVKVKQEK